MSKEHYGDLIDAGSDPGTRILVGIPMTGTLRSEWVMARYGQVSPTNWSQRDMNFWIDQYSPLRFSVADARNMIASKAVEIRAEWVFFIDHDVCLPPGTLIRMNEYMQSKERPIVSGLYFTKGVPSEPLLYRGFGTSFATGWKMGERVDASGCGLGCTLIHGSIFREFASECEEYTLKGESVRRFFRTPYSMEFDKDTGLHNTLHGTEDLDFYNRIHLAGVYEKCGWPEVQAMKYPILVDTSIFCRHIDFSGKMYPMFGEDQKFK